MTDQPEVALSIPDHGQTPAMEVAKGTAAAGEVASTVVDMEDMVSTTATSRDPWEATTITTTITWASKATWA
jgi:hypothetical protein